MTKEEALNIDSNQIIIFVNKLRRQFSLSSNDINDILTFLEQSGNDIYQLGTSLQTKLPYYSKNKLLELSVKLLSLDKLSDKLFNLKAGIIDKENITTFLKTLEWQYNSNDILELNSNFQIITFNFLSSTNSDFKGKCKNSNVDIIDYQIGQEEILFSQLKEHVIETIILKSCSLLIPKIKDKDNHIQILEVDEEMLLSDNLITQKIPNSFLEYYKQIPIDTSRIRNKIHRNFSIKHLNPMSHSLYESIIKKHRLALSGRSIAKTFVEKGAQYENWNR